MKRKFLKFVGCFLVVFVSSLIIAAPKISPTGLWRTYDLDGVPRSIVKFTLVNGRLQGKIIKLLSTKGQKSTDRCTKCTGKYHNKRKEGLVIIWGLKKEGGKWVGGRVLDTDSGKTYKCRVTLSPDGKIMYFHAYIGAPFLGRTVNWMRVK